MLIEKIRAVYEAKAVKRNQTGNPTGSRLGGCCAALQFLAYPELSRPEPFQPRGVMVMEDGDVFAEILDNQIKDAIKGHPGMLWGLRETPFFFPVPLPDDLKGTGALDRIAEKFEAGWKVPGRLWGTVHSGFVPPRIYRREGASRLTIRGIEQEINGKPLSKTGAILDPDARDAAGNRRPTVYLPVYVDGILDDPTIGLTVVEKKSMSNFAFRRALLGNLDYQYRCQLAAATVGAEMANALWLCVRKETHHLGEVMFVRGAERTLVRLRALSGELDAYVVTNAQKGRVIPEAGGEEQEFPGQATWDLGYSTTPWDPDVVQQMRDRALRVLLFDGDFATVSREYGPDFRCLKCAGQGHRECGLCHGTGLAPRTKSPKPCSRCASEPKEGKPDMRVRRKLPDPDGPILEIGGPGPLLTDFRGQQHCADCDGKGLLERVELGAFPCGYCSLAVPTCWAPAGVERVIDSRPHLFITREGWEKSGLTFTPPEPPVLVPAAVEDEEEADA